MLESVYEKALCYELQSQGFEVRQQVPVKVKYRDIFLDLNLQLDIIVDNSVILELKSVAELLPVHKKQLLNYMRLTGTKLGYIINFNEYSLKDGIERIVNDFW